MGTPRSLAAAALGLLAMTHTGHAGSPPVDPRAEWRVGFTALRTVHVAVENSYLSTSIPRLLMERLAPIRHHALSAEERRGHARRVLAGAVRTESELLVELQRRRDRQVLERSAADGAGEELAAARKRLLELRELPLGEVEIASRKPLSLAPADADDLLPAPRFSPLQVALAADLDLLITGALEEVEGVLFMEIAAVDSTLGRRVLTYRDALSRGGLEAALDELVEQLAQLLIGAPWGALTVTPTPPQSAVYVDDRLAGTGVTHVPYQAVGSHTIRVVAPHHEPLERAVELTGDGLTLALALQPVPPRLVLIDSEPAGATVYLDSVNLGVTPLRVEVGADPARALLRLSGYHDAAVVLRTDTVTPLQVVLAPAEFDLAQRQREQRDRFYGRFGEALLSLAGPLILFAGAGDPKQHLRTRGLLIGGGVAALTVSGALLVRAASALGDYLDASSQGAR